MTDYLKQFKRINAMFRLEEKVTDGLKRGKKPEDYRPEIAKYHALKRNIMKSLPTDPEEILNFMYHFSHRCEEAEKAAEEESGRAIELCELVAQKLEEIEKVTGEWEKERRR